nr:outer membrane lipoprotein chaperone LolA [Psychrobacter sp. I-STPA10]
MKKISKAILGSVLSASALFTIPMMVVSQTANAAAADNITAANRLNELLAKTKSMTANFSQTTQGASSASGAKNGTFSGSMSVQRPNQFRWETKVPAEQLIVGNSSRLWIYDKDIKQATRQNVDKQMGNTPALLLSGDPNKIADNFKITQPNTGKNYYVLYPKASDANFKSLAISFNKKKPVMMVLNDSLGQTTSIKFSNVKLNTNISSAQFAFTPPDGIDVISQ